MGSRLLALALAAVATAASAETLLPLDAEDAELLPTGALEIVIGTEGREGFRPLFRDVERDREWTTPTVGINAGLGTRAEAQFRWSALAIDDKDAPSEHGSGDASFFTKVRVFSAGDYGLEWLPATALRFGVKLPNAKRSRGLGTDETDVFGNVLFSRAVGPLRVHGAAGIGILGNPGTVGRQDDVFLYDGAVQAPAVLRSGRLAVDLFAGVSGLEASRFGNVQHRALGGIRLGGETFALYLGAGAGLNEDSEDLVVRAGLVGRFRVFGDD